MFTGIVTDIGQVLSVEQRGDLRAILRTSYAVGPLAIGASIACDGVCLTLVDKGADPMGATWFSVDISKETLEKTTIGSGHNAWKIGRKVNLERALRIGDELGGHIVSGHVDGLAEIEAIRIEGDSTRVTLAVPQHLARFIAEKGSVALNGASLTVNEVNGNRFGVNLIPHTKAVTTWGEVKIGDQINLEIDTLARYVARLGEMRGQSSE